MRLWWSLAAVHIHLSARGYEREVDSTMSHIESNILLSVQTPSRILRHCARHMFDRLMLVHLWPDRRWVKMHLSIQPMYHLVTSSPWLSE